MLLTQRVDLDMHFCYSYIYRYGNVPQTTAKNSDTPLIHVQHSVDTYIQLPTSLQCDPFQMDEVVLQGYISY
jgi:hypothetical protein